MSRNVSPKCLRKGPDTNLIFICYAFFKVISQIQGIGCDIFVCCNLDKVQLTFVYSVFDSLQVVDYNSVGIS